MKTIARLIVLAAFAACAQGFAAEQSVFDLFALGQPYREAEAALQAHHPGLNRSSFTPDMPVIGGQWAGNGWECVLEGKPFAISMAEDHPDFIVKAVALAGRPQGVGDAAAVQQQWAALMRAAIQRYGQPAKGAAFSGSPAQRELYEFFHARHTAVWELPERRVDVLVGERLAYLVISMPGYVGSPSTTNVIYQSQIKEVKPERSPQLTWLEHPSDVEPHAMAGLVEYRFPRGELLLRDTRSSGLEYIVTDYPSPERVRIGDVLRFSGTDKGAANFKGSDGNTRTAIWEQFQSK